MSVNLPPLITLQRLTWQSMLIGLCLVAAYVNLMLTLQMPISVNVGQGWDGYYYYRMAAHADISGIYYAFKIRFGLPWLAGEFPTHDILLNFKIINLVCALLYMVGCYVIVLRCSVNMHRAVPVIGWCLICMSNLAPIPSLLWYPIQTDIVCSFFALLFLVMMVTGCSPLWAVALLFLIGTTVRENFPIFLLYALLRIHLSYDKKQSIHTNLKNVIKANSDSLAIIICGLLASLLGFYCIYLYTGGSPFGDRLTDFLLTCNSYIKHPMRLVAASINSISVVTFIAIAAAGLHFPIKYREHLLGAPFAKLIIIVSSFIAITGGTNPERYWYWSMPFLVLCILPAINGLLHYKRYLLLLICLLWAAFIQRAVVPIDVDGIARGCDLTAILTGHSNWIGHWANMCDLSAQTLLAKLAAAVVALIITMSVLSRLYDKNIQRAVNP